MKSQTSVLNEADSLFATGNYSKAIEVYKSYDQASEVLEKIAKSYVSLGNYDEALSNYSEALKATPENVFLKFDYAKLLRSTKHNKEAALLFDELAVADLKNPNYQYELGVTLDALNDSTAIDHFRKAFQLDATHQKAIYRIAKDYLVDRNYSESLKYIDIGLSSYQNNVELISLKAQNFYWKQEYREAALWFEKLITLGESSQFIREKLCFCYANHYDYKNAVEQGLLALEYDKNNWTNLFIVGKMYEGMENFEKAAEYMTLALEIRDIPLDDEYRKLGYALNRQSKHKEAIDALQKSLKINPNNDKAQFYMLMAKDRYYKDIDSRIKLFEDFSSKNPKSYVNEWVVQRIKELKEEKFMKGEE